MKIYLYLRDFPSEPVTLNGGMDKAVGGLAAGLVANGAQAVILCEGPRNARFARPPGCEVVCFDNSATRARQFAIAPDLRKFVETEIRAGDLVILNAIFHTSVFMLSRILRKRGIPYIVAPHDPYHPSIFAKSSLKKWGYWYACEKPTLRAAAAIQVLDQRHADFVRRLGVKTPVIEVINGFAPTDVPEESALTWDANRPAEILFLGRIDRQNKGLDVLIDAFALVIGAHPGIRLTIQGPDSGDRSALESQARALGLTRQVEFRDPDFGVRPGDLAGRFDLFVLPSRFEGFGLSAMEAMLAARPVLVTEVAGIAPHVRAAACGVVADSTVESIRTALLGILSRRADWKSMGLRGREYVLRNFDWTFIASEALGEYTRLVTAGS
ncbi:MAG: glycosyltransferase [Tepidisphaeraceae bacterium]